MEAWSQFQTGPCDYFRISAFFVQKCCRLHMLGSHSILHRKLWSPQHEPDLFVICAKYLCAHVQNLQKRSVRRWAWYLLPSSLRKQLPHLLLSQFLPHPDNSVAASFTSLHADGAWRRSCVNSLIVFAMIISPSDHSTPEITASKCSCAEHEWLEVL